MPTRARPGRMTASMLASTIVHVVAVALFVRVGGPPAAPVVLPDAVVVIPVSLVRLGGGGQGGGPMPAAPTPEPAMVETAVAPPRPRPVAAAPTPKKRAPSPVVAAATRRAPAATPARGARTSVPSSSSAAGSTEVGDGRPGGGTAGDEAGGDGSGGARPAYGSNPLPPYPMIARRLGIEGRVLLAVVVRPDGRAASVRVRTSSGNGALDRAAVETVRTKWRFVPARAGGVPVESTVTVPIRFRLDRG